VGWHSAGGHRFDQHVVRQWMDTACGGEAGCVLITLWVSRNTTEPAPTSRAYPSSLTGVQYEPSLMAVLLDARGAAEHDPETGVA
jgi:hypothetical protein